MEVGKIGGDDTEHEGGEGEENECPLTPMIISRPLKTLKKLLLDKIA
jgi:hypothetical protein